MRQRNKKWIIALLLLLVLSFAFVWTRNNYSKEIPPNFQLQDSTVIAEGNMEIKIWDYSIIDGDTINVFFDGKKIFKKLLIVDTPVYYKPGIVKAGRHWIGVEALSEGSIGAATVHLELSNGKENYEFNIEARKDKPAYRLIIVN